REREPTRTIGKMPGGPRPPAEKPTRRQTPQKTGITPNPPPTPGKAPAEPDPLHDELYSPSAPANPDERNLLDLMITNQWNLRRLHAVHTQMWTRAIESDRDSPHNDPANPLVRPFNRNDDQFAKLQRMINAADPSFHPAR